jgi:hypothetical protein
MKLSLLNHENISCGLSGIQGHHNFNRKAIDNDEASRYVAPGGSKTEVGEFRH